MRVGEVQGWLQRRYRVPPPFCTMSVYEHADMAQRTRMFGYAMVMLARNREMSGEQRLPALQLMRMLAPCLPLSVLPPAVQRVLSTVRRVIPQQCSTAVAVHDRSMCAFVGSPLVRR